MGPEGPLTRIRSWPAKEKVFDACHKMGEYCRVIELLCQVQRETEREREREREAVRQRSRGRKGGTEGGRRGRGGKTKKEED